MREEAVLDEGDDDEAPLLLLVAAAALFLLPSLADSDSITAARLLKCCCCCICPSLLVYLVRGSAYRRLCLSDRDRARSTLCIYSPGRQVVKKVL